MGLFISPETMQVLFGLGIAPDKALELLRCIERDQEAVQKPAADSEALEARRAAERGRKRAERDRKRDCHVTVTGRSAESHAEPPSSSALPPKPPIPPTPTPGDTTRARGVVDFGFARFWEAYPRKVAKAEAERVFPRAVKRAGGADPLATILGGLERAKAAWHDPQFIPHAATWLNQARWQDEPDHQPIAKPYAQRSEPPPSAKALASQANLDRALRGFEAAARFTERNG